MAAQPKAKPVAKHHITAKQLAADRANLKAARAAAAQKSRSAKQKAASRLNLAKARAAQHSRRKGKKAVAPKKAAAPVPRETDLLTGQNLHSLPVCASVALAAHLAWWTGAVASAPEILALNAVLSGASLISDAIEAADEYGFCGFRPDRWARCDVSTQGVPGLIYGLPVLTGYHAVLALPAGMLSWSLSLPWPGEPAEAWHLEWADIA